MLDKTEGHSRETGNIEHKAQNEDKQNKNIKNNNTGNHKDEQ